MFEEEAVVELLQAHQLFVSATDAGETTLCVNCNDVFYWGCADAEALPYSQIKRLWQMWKADTKWGVDKWVCLQRGRRPQWCVIRDMKKDGVWDAAMEALPVREDEGSIVVNPVFKPSA